MSEQSPFVPFMPGNEAPAAPEKPKERVKRKKREQKALVRKEQVNAGFKAADEAMKQAAFADPPKKTRKPRAAKVKAAKPAPKFDLQTILKATAGLKEADMAAFDKGITLMMDTPKTSRGRVLSALAQVFS